MIIGAQLYTLREYTRDTESLAHTLEKVAQIGFRAVQLSATCPFEPDWMKEQLDKFGLVCPVTHSSFQNMIEDAKKVVSDHNIFGCKGIGIGGMHKWNADVLGDYEEFLPLAKKVACGISAEGAQFMYHNHDREFVKCRDGKTLLECMKEDFTPEEMSFILDTFWVQVGGGDPAQYIRKFSGRIKCIHFKDYVIYNGQRRIAAIGEGNMNYDAVISACLDTGIEYAFVELDDCYGADPFDALKRSYDYLKTKGLK